MADRDESTPTLGRPSDIIRPRPQAGPVVGVMMSLLFGLSLAPIMVADGWLFGDEITAEQPAPVTVRVGPLTRFSRDGMTVDHGAIVVARGEVPNAERARLATLVRAHQPHGWGTLAAFAGGFFVVGMLFTSNLRRSHRGKLLRTQAVTLISLVLVALGLKAAAMWTPLSMLVVPVAGVGILATVVVDRSTGLATGLVAGAVVGCLVPFDLGLFGVLAVQVLATLLALGDRKGHLAVLLAGSFGGIAAAVTYGLLYYLTGDRAPVEELSSPLQSAWVASAAAGPLAAVVATLAKPVYQWLLGDITRNRLVNLSDLSHPLLKRIADNAPGTWQHSLAMANMAEVAANSIGANSRLVRAGAYYHDLGKSLQPSYFIENLAPGEPSPHDDLAPEQSRDAIFRHVTDGVRLARESGLPERIIDFMHMHHGDGQLEYFWAKCREQGNPGGLTPEYFHYPGVRPQSKETAILAICDAVEAASRTLRTLDEESIRRLVQRIVYGKLDLGQLDQSGLTMSDLRTISESLVNTIKHSAHGRIEYQWQREEREQQQGPEEAAASPETESTTQKMFREPRLDSLDIPRPRWEPRKERRSTPSKAQPEATASSDLPTAEAPESANEPEAADPTIPVPRLPPPPPEPRSKATVFSSAPPPPKRKRKKPPAQIVDDPEPRPDLPAELPLPAPEESMVFQRADEPDVDSDLGAWQSALGKISRKKRSTIDLMDSGSGQVESPLSTGGSEPLVPARASTEDDELAPGMMVLGPPPGTHPERAPDPSESLEVTVKRAIPPHPDAFRDDQGPTAEREVEIPPEAYPDEIEPTEQTPVPAKAPKSSKS